MFLVDTAEGRILEDEEVKRDIAARWPYRQWLERNVFTFDELPRVPAPARLAGEELLAAAARLRLHRRGPRADPRAHGRDGQGADRLHGHGHAARGAQRPGARASSRYFHQLFAQVTNPPIDPIRESLVMTLEHRARARTATRSRRRPSSATGWRCPARSSPTAQLAQAGRASATRACSSPSALSLLYPVGRRRGRAGAGGGAAVQAGGGGGGRRAPTSSS